MLIYPRQREYQQSWENVMFRTYCTNSVTLKGKHRGIIYRRLETKVLDKESTRQEKTDYRRVLPYLIILPYITV